MHFRPCVSRHACTEDGTHCRACGRSHDEIAVTRRLMAELSDFILAMDYENVEEFLAYVKLKVEKKVIRKKS